MTFKKGFIAPPWPHTKGDSISADSLIERAEKKAIQSCGLYYEIYEYRTLCALKTLLDKLSSEDAITFLCAAHQRGFEVTESAISESRQFYDEKIDEIKNNLRT
ncbi:hypothetical protein [Pantoea sp. BAV 3049]|uniref:hypothetical protein n=1 Tax=Pantoea sp. BAV 3049 TaxID=2654188 RepID=UPI00131A83C0|nr:hypothetical protein [Pantoea sp. BAV 3049]